MPKILPVLILAALLLPTAGAAQQVLNADDQSLRDEAMARRREVGDVWIPPRAAVLRNGKRWIAPAYSERDLYLDRPWREGRFTLGIGPNYLWRLGAGTHERFDLGGAWFAVAPADSLYAAWWRWTRDDMVLYPDPAHPGWYRIYNTRLGTYGHVRLLGYAKRPAAASSLAARE